MEILTFNENKQVNLYHFQRINIGIQWNGAKHVEDSMCVCVFALKKNWRTKKTHEENERKVYQIEEKERKWFYVRYEAAVPIIRPFYFVGLRLSCCLRSSIGAVRQMEMQWTDNRFNGINTQLIDKNSKNETKKKWTKLLARPEIQITHSLSWYSSRRAVSQPRNSL